MTNKINKPRNKLVPIVLLKTGAGFHEKNNKQKRLAEKRKLIKEIKKIKF